MMSRTDFENHLSDYVRGELAPARLDEVEEYLASHPEALEGVAELRNVLVLTGPVRDSAPPEQLIREADAGLMEQLQRRSASAAVDLRSRPQRSPLPRHWSLYGAAAMLLLAAMAVLWESSPSVAYADVVHLLRTVRSFRVEGWVRSADGSRTAYRQWLQTPGSWRAEVGTGADQRVVVSDGDVRRIGAWGRVFTVSAGEAEASTFEWAVERLHGFVGEGPKDSAWRVERNEKGDAVHFTVWLSASLGSGPSERKLQMEVDADTALPRRAVVLQQVKDEWLVMSEMLYLDYGAAFGAELFQVSGDVVSGRLDDAERRKLWFELHISPLSAFMPAVHVPEGGSEIVLVDPATTGPRRGASGWSWVTIAGVVHHDFHRTPLHEALRQITGRVVRGEIGNQRLSARVKYRTELPWEDRVRPVLTALRLRGEPGQATGTKTRYVFTHDGRELPQSRLPRGGSSVIEDTPSGHRFTFERTALLSVVANVFRNSSGTGFNAGLDTLEFQWTGRPEQSPFRHRVDLRAESSGTWEENLDVLRNQFGVRVERVEMPVVYPTLALRAAERQP